VATSTAKTVDAYLAELPADRREAIAAVRKVILKHLPKGYKECMAFGMIVYVIPLQDYPVTYNKQPLMYAALASQKNYMSVYLCNVYGHKETDTWFRKRWAETGKKLDMGKSCVRFKTLEDLPLDVIGETIARTPVERFIRVYEQSRVKA
jgi:hypothetical protein